VIDSSRYADKPLETGHSPLDSNSAGGRYWGGSAVPALPETRGGETAMRMMLRWTVPVERGNAAVEDGSMGRVIESLVELLQPEAAYFMPEGGERSGMMFFDMADPSEIAQIAERLFLSFDAAVEFVPVMNSDDLKKALAKLSS